MGEEGQESFRTMEVRKQFPFGTAVELRTCSGKGSLKANNTLNMCRVCEYDIILPERYFPYLLINFLVFSVVIVCSDWFCLCFHIYFFLPKLNTCLGF